MRKIYFNDMVQQTWDVIEGKITQFRSIISPQPTYHKDKGVCWKGGAYGATFRRKQDDYMNFVSGTEYNRSCRRFRVGEVLAVAQSYKDAGYFCHYYNDTDEFMFIMKDSRDVAVPPVAVYNKLFVKAEYMPHKICVKRVRMEKLQDISDEDCYKSGVIAIEPEIKSSFIWFSSRMPSKSFWIFVIT